jgi:hypothetical protein
LKKKSGGLKNTTKKAGNEHNITNLIKSNKAARYRTPNIQSRMQEAFQESTFYKSMEAYMESESHVPYQNENVEQVEKKVRLRKRKNASTQDQDQDQDQTEHHVKPAKGKKKTPLPLDESIEPSVGTRFKVPLIHEPTSFEPGSDEPVNTVPEISETKMEEVPVVIAHLEEHVHENMSRADIEIFLCKKYNKVNISEVMSKRICTKEERKIYIQILIK